MSSASRTPKLLLQAIRQEPVARRPLWIMRQAGRYLPEYREFRTRHSFKALAAEPALAAEVTLMPLKRYPLDAAIVFADIMSPLPALGIEFDFDPGPIVAAPLRTAGAIAGLRDAGGADIAPEVIATLRLVRAALPPATALLGFCGAPWTLAAYLVEGKGTKDFPTLRAFAAAEPALLAQLLERLTSLQIEYLRRQCEAGADAVQIFDSWAGLLSVKTWQRWIRPHLQRLLAATADLGVPRILFLQNAPHLVASYAGLPAEVLGVDWRVELGDLQRLYPDRALQGNLEPAILAAGPAATRTAARELLADVAPRGHIVNLGHGILPQTPLASVDALVDVVHSEKL
jgi:uroporphyrinogen decarboxylase